MITKIKFLILLSILIIGGIIIAIGLHSMIKGPPPEHRPPFESGEGFWVIHEPEPPIFGVYVRIDMRPTEAFVMGDIITTNVEVEISAIWPEIDYAEVTILFPEAICILENKTFAPWNQNYPFLVKEFEEPEGEEGLTHIFRQDITMFYPHEGIFGVNVTVSAQNYADVYCNYYNVVNIELYRYLEERRMTHITQTISQQVLGLSIIAIGPILMKLVELGGKVFKRNRKRA